MSFIITSMKHPENPAKDGREYYTLGARSVMPNGQFNPFEREGKRNVWQQFRRGADGVYLTDENGEKIREWIIGDPSQVEPLMRSRTPITGEIVTKVVEPYQIKGVHPTTGEEMINTATTYTTIIFPRENVETVFRNAGHPIAKEQSQEELNDNAPVENEDLALTR